MGVKDLLHLVKKKIILINRCGIIFKKIEYKSSLEKVKHIVKWDKVYSYFIRIIPQQHHLTGTILHRVFGERLFAPHIWKPTKISISGGLAVGIFIALTPTIGVQMILSIMAAYFLRVNIPAAIAACWITNPLTAPVIFPLQYKLGTWLSGVPEPDELTGYTGMLRHFVRYARPLWVGSLLSATFFALLVYIGSFSVWGLVSLKLRNKRTSHTE
jgi:uncharacterized protein